MKAKVTRRRTEAYAKQNEQAIKEQALREQAFRSLINSMKKVKVSGPRLEAYKEWPNIVALINETCKGVKFPCMAVDTGEFDDRGNSIVRLPNGREITTAFLDF